MYTIHPSVLMNISEHHTRMSDAKVSGILLGKKEEIIDSFELCGLPDEQMGAILANFNRKCALVKQVSPELDLIGFYSTAFFDYERLRKHLSSLIPNLIFVFFEPYRRDGSIPITIYQYRSSDLDKVEWTIVTDDIEIIGLNNSRLQPSSAVSGCPSNAIDNLSAQRSAVKMLKDRIKVISKYIKDVQSGKLPYHRETILDIFKLCQRFPIMNTAQYTQAYNLQCNDVALNTYLGILTNGSINKMNVGMPPLPILKSRAPSATHARR